MDTQARAAGDQYAHLVDPPTNGTHTFCGRRVVSMLDHTPDYEFSPRPCIRCRSARRRERLGADRNGLDLVRDDRVRLADGQLALIHEMMPDGRLLVVTDEQATRAIPGEIVSIYVRPAEVSFVSAGPSV